MIKRGADVNAKNKIDGTTPLMYAIRRLNINAVKLLLKKGADVSAAAKDGRTPLMHAILAAGTTSMTTEYNPRNNPPGYSQTFRQALEIVRLLIKHGADVHVRNKDGRTPLINACISFGYPKPSVIKLMIAKGADIKAKGNNGMTALDCVKAGLWESLYPKTAKELISLLTPPDC